MPAVHEVTTNCCYCHETISVPVEHFNYRATASHRLIGEHCPERGRAIEFETPDLAHVDSTIAELRERVQQELGAVRALMDQPESRHRK